MACKLKPSQALNQAYQSLVEKLTLQRSSDYVPPKRPYSFLAILDDILLFAVDTLVDNGRLSFWMPTANEEDQQIPPPTHPCLETVAVCVQVFNKCELLQ